MTDRISTGRFLGSVAGLLLALACVAPASANASADGAPGPDPTAQQRAAFIKAWEALRTGDRATFEAEKRALGDYLLYPYLEYNSLLLARSTADPARMADFLTSHQDWAFARGLERAWLRRMGERGRWDVLVQYADGHTDTEVRCYLARARLERGQTGGVESEAQSLWLSGQSQPKACDPLFDWLIREGGVSSALAWQRIKLAFEARHPHLVRYLKRFLDPDAQAWADRWLEQDKERYARLDRALRWPDSAPGRDISAYGLSSLARLDADHAWQHFEQLDGHFAWSEARRATILSEIALWSAVEGSPGTFERMAAVPPRYRDGRLIEWWARAGLIEGDWGQVEQAISQMAADLRDDDRWLFWGARAAIENGRPDQGLADMGVLAARATYYGFLAADHLDEPYSICAETPSVEPDAVRQLRNRPDFSRSLELRLVGLENWARAEWGLAAGRLDEAGLRVAAALAVEENWADAAILALADSGDLNWYEWRFPLSHHETVKAHTGTRQLDPSWVMGLMRSESAMAADAVSSAGARGLMQITPATARALSRRHGFSYSGAGDLMRADYNIELGTTYLRELLDSYGDNSVLASGAYNAGPNAVKRWLDGSRPTEAAMWIETLPYFETREYIPRVLAFSTIYDWRLAQPVVRVSSRMPALDSGKMSSPKIAEVECPGTANMGAR